MLLLPVCVSAHHSRSYYSTEQVEFEAEILEVLWRNPHIGFMVRRVDDADPNAVLRVEAASIYMLLRTGITEDLFEVGDRVRIAGNQSERKERDFLATNMLLSDGTEAVIMPNAQTYWSSDEQVGGRANWALDESQLEIAAAEARGIFRVWSSPQQRPGGRGALPLTDAARAAREAWDPLESFALKCEQPGMARAMVGNPHPIEFVRQGDDLVMRIEENDVVRVIHMDSLEKPADQAATPQGYSLGRWVEGVLVVETTRINWPYFDSTGTPQSEAIAIVERFTLSSDESRLDYEITVTDPEIFTEPATLSRYWLALGETVEPYECEVG